MLIIKSTYLRMQVSWGKTVLLVGGELNPASDRVEGIVLQPVS